MITIGVKGLDRVKANLAKLKNDSKVELEAILERGARTFVRNAKRDAPVDLGVLRNEITYFPAAPFQYTVVSGAKYSPYLEWGTITKVNVPGELAEYASQFKRRGIRKTGGIYPRPFFFKQSGPVQLQLERDIETLLNSLDL